MNSYISNVISTTKLEEKLIDINYPLEEYLKDDESIQCYKNMNSNLNIKKYFTPEKIKKLIKFITEEPEDDDYFRGHKFPYIACELLKTDCSYIQDLFVLTNNEYNKKYNEGQLESNNSYENSNENKALDNKTKENIIDIKEKEPEENNLLKDKKEKIEVCKEEEENNKENKNEINIVSNDNSNSQIKEEIMHDVEKDKKNEKIKEEAHNEFLDLLLNFVTSGKQELNYVLCGYFSDVLMTLIDKYPLKIMEYLYITRKDALKEIISHSYQESLSKISSKFLKLMSFISDNIKNIEILNEVDENYKTLLFKKCLKYRNELIKQIIYSITIDGIKDEYGNIHKNLDIENIFLLLNDLITEDLILKIIVENPLIYTHIFDLLNKKIVFNNDNDDENNKNQKFIYILCIRFLTEIIQNINYIKEGFILIKDSDMDLLFEVDAKSNSVSFNTKFVITLIHILKNEFVDISFNKLGIQNIYIMELIIVTFSYMKEAPIIFDFIITHTNFIQKSIEYFFKYQQNNMYHIRFANLFKLYLDSISAHEKITHILFYTLKFHEILSDYIMQEESPKNNENVKEQNKFFSYKNKHYFKSGKYMHNGVYPFIARLMHLLQEKSGLKICDKKEKKDLEDENSKDKVIEMQTSEILYKTFILSSKWNYAFENKVLPIINKYNKKFFYELDINKNIENKNKEMKTSNSFKNYNDVNFWKIKASIPIEAKKKINENDILTKNNNNETNMNKSQKDNTDEEDELLNIAMKLERKENQPNSNKSSSTSKTNKNILKNAKISNDKKLNNKQNELKIKNKKNNVLPKFNKKKVMAKLKLPSKNMDNKLKLNINKDKKENGNYNDINFWKINTESILSKKDIDEIFNYL